MTDAVRTTDDGAVRRLTFCRPERYNTITPQFRDELGAALDDAQHARNVRVILLDAEGPAFCAGYGLDWSTAAQANDDRESERAWDPQRTSMASAATPQPGRSTTPPSRQSLPSRAGASPAARTSSLQRSPDRRRRANSIRLSTLAGLGHPRSPMELGGPHGPAAGASLHAHW